jgi:hypothetical protein
MIYEYAEPQWNDIDRRKLKNLKKNLSLCHFVHHKSTWTEPGLCRERLVINSLSHGKATI